MKKKIIKVLANTKLKDLKAGDLVITGELHRVVKINNKNYISVITVKPECDFCKKHKQKCGHERIMGVGYGQQNFLKVQE